MKNRKSVRWITAALVLCLLAAIPSAAQAASPSPTPGTGVNMTVYQFRGTHTVTDADGVELDKTENQKLYPGNTVRTGSGSYTWITVGSTFWMKLDENSSVTLNSSGANADILLNEGRIFYCFTTTEETQKGIRLRTPIASLEAVNASGMLESDIVIELDKEETGRIGRVENDCILTVLTGEAVLTFWKAEALTPGDPDKVKHQTMTVVAGEQAQLQDVTMLEAPSEEDGGRPVRREQTSKISEVDSAAVLEENPFVGEEYVSRAQLGKLLTLGEEAMTSTELQAYGKTIESRLSDAEKLSADKRTEEQTALKGEQETFSAMLKKAALYWNEVQYVFPLTKEEILNPTPPPPATPAPTPTPPPDTFTVTLMWGDSVFGVQHVEEGWFAGEPSLMPTRRGEWRIKGTDQAFDFYATTINSDLVLCWYSE